MKKRPLSIVCLAFLIVRSILLVFTGGATFAQVPASSIFSKTLKNADIVVEGQVYKKETTSKVQKLYLKNNSLIQNNHLYKESNILIYDDSFSEVPIGKIVKIKGKGTGFESARNPGNFDSQIYYAKQNIFGQIWCDEILSISGEEDWISERLYQLRQTWKNLLYKNMSEANSRVLGAMLLGEKSEMATDLKEQYQKAGISHVLAISGLHISFIGLGLYGLLRKAGLPYFCAGIGAVFVLTGYTFMIGFSVSVFRAYVMLLLRMGADITGRVYDMVTGVMLSAATLVEYQPLYLTDGAFYLSHGAILGLGLILPELKGILLRKRWLEGVTAGLAVNITLFPILLWFYFEISLYSLLINFLVVPLMTWVLSLGMLGSIGSLIWQPMGKIFLMPCDWILSLFHWLGNISCTLPFSTITYGRPNWWEVVIYYVVLIVSIYMLRKVNFKMSKPDYHKKIGRIKIVAIGLLCGLVFSVTFVKFPNGKLQVTMLDVGQGDCIFMKGPKGDTYLIDGGSSDVKEVAKYRIESFLKSQGVGSLDFVFVSHGDADHYVGIKEMIRRQMVGVKIQTLIIPSNYEEDEELKDLVKLATQHEVDVMVMNAGQKIMEGELNITCLQPSENDQLPEGNISSMVLDVTFGKFDMLFTGDVEGVGEERLLSNLPEKKYDILKVAHHGSKNSTGEAFLERIQPKIAWISVGEDNSYGHPHKETLHRLQKFGSMVYETSKYGAITVESDGDFIDIFPSSI